MLGPIIDGIVLAGGRSRRLGFDKALLTFDGRPLLRIVVERLAAITDDIIVAGDHTDRYRHLSLPVRFLPDPAPDRGPLAGLQAGLSAIKNNFALVVACDMPFLNPGLLAHMASLPRRYQALAPRADGRWHPLHAMYARSCLPVIEELLAEGGDSLEELLSHLNVQPLMEDELQRHDPEGLSLFNLNRPADLAHARAVWKRIAGEPARALSS